MKSFDENILKILNKCAYKMFIVQQDADINCSCLNFTTKQAVDSCPKCLGTGKKIYIKKIAAVSQNNKTSFRGTGAGEIATTSTYFAKGDTPIYQDNIIVNGNEVDVVQRVNAMRSNGPSPVYYRCESNPKKTNIKTFLQNFNKIIGRGQL